MKIKVTVCRQVEVDIDEPAFKRIYNCELNHKFASDEDYDLARKALQAAGFVTQGDDWSIDRVFAVEVNNITIMEL